MFLRSVGLSLSVIFEKESLQVSKFYSLIKILTPNKTKVTIVTMPSDTSPYSTSCACSINCSIFSVNKFDLYSKPRKFLISDAKMVKATAEPNAEETGIDMNSTIKPGNEREGS